ncbi:hypothetical protein V6N13_013629 [Hibiscus sabdariffa]|uniref:EF-hand domain-containing protein n=2 Tax=Hibiscus sabdariffa TaxID=183260 RepID=A0ABR2P2H1_9ROSI
MENDEHFRRAFMFFDKDGSGYIELDDLRDALAYESHETDVNVPNDIMREVDTDKNYYKLYVSQILHYFGTMIFHSFVLLASILIFTPFFLCQPSIIQDGRICYDEFVAMMKAGTDWKKTSRQYSRERFKSLSLNLMKDGSLQLHDAITSQAIAV